MRLETTTAVFERAKQIYASDRAATVIVAVWICTEYYVAVVYVLAERIGSRHFHLLEEFVEQEGGEKDWGGKKKEEKKR
jgi:hypothetical protein